MKNALFISGMAVAALFGGTGEAEAAPCRSFERTFYEYGRANYQTGTECLNRWGDWETVSLNTYNNNTFFGPATPAQVIYVNDRQVYNKGYSFNLGYIDVDRRGGGQYYRRDWNRHSHNHGNKGHEWKHHDHR